MKKDYELGTDSGCFIFGYWVENRYSLGRYEHRYSFMRSPRTQRERRALFGFEHDGLPVRRKRLNLPTTYDDIMLSRNYGRSWKDYTKKRRQWEDR